MITILKPILAALITVTLLTVSCSTTTESINKERMGNAITPPRYVNDDQPPQIVSRVAPEYPYRMRQAGIQGTVILELELLKDGSVGSVEVINSVMPGKGGIDEAAIEAVRLWKFIPAQLDGEPVAVIIRIPISFALD